MNLRLSAEQRDCESTKVMVARYHLCAGNPFRQWLYMENLSNSVRLRLWIVVKLRQSGALFLALALLELMYR
jgi:hypothetical protein